MSSSSRLKEAQRLDENFNNYFGGRYSASPNSSNNFSFEKLMKNISSSYKRILIIESVLFLISIYIFYKTKPKQIMKPKQIFDDAHQEINYYLLFIYSFILSIFFIAVIMVLSYKFPVIKSVIFTNKDCDVCI